jgi:hypothetical protein
VSLSITFPNNPVLVLQQRQFDLLPRYAAPGYPAPDCVLLKFARPMMDRNRPAASDRDDIDGLGMHPPQ